MNKYHAVKETVDGITFDSKAEARRYGELCLLERAGEIRDLALQPGFELQPAFTNADCKRERAIVYRGDFKYVDCRTGLTVVEDVKGMRTPVYKMKRKMLEYVHGVVVREVKA